MPSFGEAILLIIIVLVLWKGLSWYFKIKRFFKQQQNIFQFQQQQQYQQQTQPESIELVACPKCNIMQVGKQACTRADCPNIN